MSSRIGSTWWQRVRRGSILLLLLVAIPGGLFLGCSKTEESGTPEFSQKFDKPPVDPPVPKEKQTPYKDMSPREKKALKKEG